MRDDGVLFPFRRVGTPVFYRYGRRMDKNKVVLDEFNVGRNRIEDEKIDI